MKAIGRYGWCVLLSVFLVGTSAYGNEREREQPSRHIERHDAKHQHKKKHEHKKKKDKDDSAMESLPRAINASAKPVQEPRDLSYPKLGKRLDR